MAENVVRQRLAAILAADVAGYSRLMGDDERATIDAINACRAIFREHIEANGGRVVDMAGDSVLAVFDTAIGAFTTAMAAQERLVALNTEVAEDRRMAWRIGVNLGDIHEQDDGTVYGDGVNVAARLEGLAEPGGICLSDKVQAEVRGKTERAFADLGEHEVKNIAEPVRAFRVLAEGEVAPAGAKRTRVVALAGAAVVAVVVAAIALWPSTEPPPESPPMVTADGSPTNDPVLAMPTGPAIAVLPFDNLSGDPGQEYFADGLTEQLIAALTRFRLLRVTARNTVFQYKGQSVDIPTVGADLKVQYIIEGSVRRDSDIIRVTVQLLNAGDGNHLWAETYEEDLSSASMFALQDEIIGKVAATIAQPYGIVLSAEAVRPIPENADIGAFECVLRTYAYYQVISPDEHIQVRECLERAVAQAPDYSEAWGVLAFVHMDERRYGFNPRPDLYDAYDKALEDARQAVWTGPRNATAYQALASTYFYRHELDQFLEAANRAVALNPNHSELIAEMGISMAFMGDWDTGIPLLEKAVALDPHHSGWYQMGFFYDAYRRADYQKALLAAQKMNMPGWYWNHMFLAAAHGQLGNLEEASAAIRDLEETYGTPTLSAMRDEQATFNIPSDLAERFLDGLRKAGLFDEPEAPSRPVIAVLPFDNMSGDPSQEYFADGITEDIITRLAQFPDILVLGRNTTFQFKGEAVDVKEIGARLEADYIVEGSIRRAGETVRVSAQLLDTMSGGHIWAETYDRALDPANLFAMQDEITEAVASRIGDPYGAIRDAEFRRPSRQAPQHLSSYECILRYFEYMRLLTEETHRVARDCFEAVVELEPDYGEALAFLGDLYLEEVAFGYNVVAESSLQRGLALAERAVAHDPGSGPIRARLARALYLNDDPERAIRETEEALRLEPSNVDVISLASEVFTNTGAYDRTAEMMDIVTELNPNYPAWMHWQMVKVHLARREYGLAIKELEMTQTGWWFWTHAFLAAAHCGDGDTARGREELEAALALNPGFAEVYWADMYFWNKSDDVRPMFDAVNHGLEACGWEVPPDPGPEAFAAMP